MTTEYKANALRELTARRDQLIIDIAALKDRIAKVEVTHGVNSVRACNLSKRIDKLEIKKQLAEARMGNYR